MGEVYRAHDPRLGRDVAIKVLPPAFTTDSDRLRRFEQEARAAAALNHPNILTVHEVGTYAPAPGAPAAPYVVSELLQGQTLRETIAGGPLPVRKVVDYATQIASGLAAAHEKGVVHRDLKPENLFLTRDGRIKILDFGLAKLREHEPVGAGGATMMATQNLGTGVGIVLGTAGYMSPEQVRAQPVDHRTDIFSFGTVLYEMISGTRAFRGDTAADTISAILKSDPPELTGLQGAVPPTLERIVHHCLEKAPDLRFQSARDIVFNLEALSTASATTSLIAPAPPQRRRLGVIAASRGRRRADRRRWGRRLVVRDQGARIAVVQAGHLPAWNARPGAFHRRRSEHRLHGIMGGFAARSLRGACKSDGRPFAGAEERHVARCGSDR